ncbi:MAG TPA: ABC transporter substrate-binding protein, partial [Euzebyales bacterium]|nr:ABC transporter substrate-binding protein [Euzebyales bacterium]
EAGGDATAPSEDTGGDAGGGETVTIGSVHPLTGALALDGKQMDDAVKMAVEDLNAAGDLPVTLEVASADTQGEPELGQSEAQRLIDDGAVALVGAYQSAVTTNIATVAARQQVPLVIDVAVADAILSQNNQFVYRIQPNATAMGEFGAQYLADVAEAAGEEVATVGYMHEQTDFGTSVFEAFSAMASELGIEIVETISYDAFGQSDFTTEVQQIAAAEPDVLVVTGYYNDGVAIAQNAADVQPEIKAVYGVANGAFDLPQFPEDAGDAAAYYLDSNYHFDATNERVNDIRSRFEEEYGDAMRTSAVLAYQAVEVIAAALGEVEDPSDPVALSEAIRAVEVSDPLLTFPGPISFDDTGENVNARPVVMQVLDNEIKQVYPEEFAEGEPVFPGVPWSPPQQ